MGRGDSATAALEIDDVLRVSLDLDGMEADAQAEAAAERAEALSEIDELLDDFNIEGFGYTPIKELIVEQRNSLRPDGDPDIRERVERAINLFIRSLFTYKPREETPEGRIATKIGYLRAVPTISTLFVDLGSFDGVHLRLAADAPTTLCGKKIPADATYMTSINNWGRQEPCEACQEKLPKVKNADTLKQINAMSAGVSEQDWLRVRGACATVLVEELLKRKRITDDFWSQAEEKLWKKLDSESIDVAIDRAASLPPEELFNMLFSPYSTLAHRLGEGHGADEELVALLDSFEIVLGRDRSRYAWPADREQMKTLLIDAEKDSRKHGNDASTQEVAMVALLTVRLFPEVARRHYTQLDQFGESHGLLCRVLRAELDAKAKRPVKRRSR